MIYTIRFWKYGQWNYIYEEPVEDFRTIKQLLYTDYAVRPDIQIMVAKESKDRPLLWQVYED